MKQLATFCRLAEMRRRAGASPITAITWAAGLLWRARREGTQ
ncbi:hypothetical protein [Acidovorax sp.]|nr:hypothetical protein [Acidovorax sp.]MDZ7863357.1 hypothetical protein [Acidovorax sp.]